MFITSTEFQILLLQTVLLWCCIDLSIRDCELEHRDALG